MAALTAVLGVVALLDRTWVTTLQQDPARFHAGEWWRLLTPLFVQGNGWGQYVFNMVGLLLVGVAVERQLGPYRWWAIYLGGGMVEVAVSMWAFPDRLDSGASAAVAALIGAMTVGMWRTHRLPPWPAFTYAGVFAWHLGVVDLDDTASGVAAGIVVLMVLWLAAHALAPEHLHRVVLPLITLPLIALSVTFDSHGVGWVAGVVLAIALMPPADRIKGGWPSPDGSPPRTSPA